MASLSTEREGDGGVLKRAQLSCLPKFYHANDVRHKAIEKTKAAKSTDCKLSTVILALLALTAAGGAATLVAFSGGSNALAFYEAGALGFVSTGLLVVMVVVIVRANKFNKEKNKEYDDFSQELIVDADILNAMRGSEASKSDIQTVIHLMEGAHFAQFVTLATARILPSERDIARNPLTIQDAAILSSIATHSKFGFCGDGSSLLIAQETQKIVLQSIGSQEVAAAVNSMSVGSYLAHLEDERLQESAVVFEAIVKSDRLLECDYATQMRIMGKMSSEQAKAFVAKLSEDQFKALFGDIQKALFGDIQNAYFERGGQQSALFKATVFNALAESGHTSSLEPAQQYLLMNNMSQEAADAIVRRLNLTQFKALAKYIYEVYSSNAGRPQVQRIAIQALYQEPRSQRTDSQMIALTEEQDFAFIGAMDNAVLEVVFQYIGVGKYEALVKYAFAQEDPTKVYSALAQGPTQFATLIADESLTLEIIAQVFGLMNDKKKVDFIKSVIDRLFEIQSEETAERQKLFNVVSQALDATLTVEFAALFNEPTVNTNVMELVRQFARCPIMIGRAVLPEEGRQENWYAAGMIKAFWDALSEEGKNPCVQALIDKHNEISFKSDSERHVRLARHWLSLGREYKEKNLQMPELLIRARDGFCCDLAKRLESRGYEYFREMIVDNGRISKNQEERYRFALDLLERMDESAAKGLIEQIDKGRVGHDRYVGMLAILMKEVHILNGGPIAEERDRLCHLFQNAAQRQKAEKALSKTANAASKPFFEDRIGRTTDTG